MNELKPHEELISVLSKSKFPVQNEKETQRDIERVLTNNNISFKRECNIGNGDIPDFVVSDCIVVEVKIKGRPVDILKQCTRYCQHDTTQILILITNKLMGFPKEINGKPCYVINMGKSWL